METNQALHASIHWRWSVFQSSYGEMKYSISICSNSLLRKMKLRGVISFLNALPICAMPKGTFTRVVSQMFLKSANMP